jgi:hypothetical protein
MWSCETTQITGWPSVSPTISGRTYLESPSACTKPSSHGHLHGCLADDEQNSGCTESQTRCRRRRCRDGLPRFVNGGSAHGVVWQSRSANLYEPDPDVMTLRKKIQMNEPESWRYRFLDLSAPSIRSGSLYPCAERQSR